MSFVVGLAACAPRPSDVEASWARWFSFATIRTAQADPTGTFVVVVGDSNADVGGPAAQEQPGSPWVVTIDSEGHAIDRAVPERTVAVVIDTAGSAYALVAGAGDPATGGAPCRLVAVDIDGATRWEQPWPGEEPTACDVRPTSAGEIVVLRDELELTALSSAGAPVWRSSLPHDCDSLRWRERALWCAADRTAARPASIVRCDVADGFCRSVALDPSVDTIADYDVSATAIVVRDCTIEGISQTCRIVGFDRDGSLRWSSERSGGPGFGGPFVIASERGHWLVGTHRSSGIEETPPRDLSLRHLTPDGTFDLRLRRRFVEAPEDAADRERCPDAGDAPRSSEAGTVAQAVLRLDDDRFFVVGRQGCRDAFVLALEVRP